MKNDKKYINKGKDNAKLMSMDNLECQLVMKHT